MQYYTWNNEKNEHLKNERDISFEEVVFHIGKGDLLDTIQSPGQKYQNQRMVIVSINNHVYLVPFVEGKKEIFLKTIIPMRKATKKYLKKK